MEEVRVRVPRLLLDMEPGNGNRARENHLVHHHQHHEKKENKGETTLSCLVSFTAVYIVKKGRPARTTRNLFDSSAVAIFSQKT